MEGEDIKKRWQEYTEELYKKDLHDLDNHDGVITHIEPDILECEVKWALGSITMPGEGKGYPFQYSDLENSTDCIVHSVAKSQTRLIDFHFHFSPVRLANTKEYNILLVRL